MPPKAQEQFGVPVTCETRQLAHYINGQAGIVVAQVIDTLPNGESKGKNDYSIEFKRQGESIFLTLEEMIALHSTIGQFMGY